MHGKPLFIGTISQVGLFAAQFLEGMRGGWQVLLPLLLSWGTSGWLKKCAAQLVWQLAYKRGKLRPCSFSRFSSVCPLQMLG